MQILKISKTISSTRTECKRKTGSQLVDCQFLVKQPEEFCILFCLDILDSQRCPNCKTIFRRPFTK